VRVPQKGRLRHDPDPERGDPRDQLGGEKDRMIDADARAALGHRAHRVLDGADGGLDAEVADRVTDHVAPRAPRREQQRRQLLARVEEEAAHRAAPRRA